MKTSDAIGEIPPSSTLDGLHREIAGHFGFTEISVVHPERRPDDTFLGKTKAALDTLEIIDDICELPDGIYLSKQADPPTEQAPADHVHRYLDMRCIQCGAWWENRPEPVRSGIDGSEGPSPEH